MLGFLKNTHNPLLKIAKMIGVTLRHKWITWAMLMVPGLRARPYIREAITKNVYISPGSGSLVGDNDTHSVVY